MKVEHYEDGLHVLGPTDELAYQNIQNLYNKEQNSTENYQKMGRFRTRKLTEKFFRPQKIFSVTK